MHEVTATEEEDAWQKGRPLRQVTLTIKPGLGKDPNVYNLPAAVNEVAAIFVDDPMTYPLIFPHGEHGYTSGLSHSVIVSGSRNIVTGNQYRIMQRCHFSILHHSGKLFQQYVVDAYCKAESFRISFIRRNQGKLSD
ncbi:hypothetical protein PR048_005052 [Dryococelus australis]|uniref:Uncharacterized protein n=1 Tax=Dryococelus australis TaxID=614101 RepID=A0ABQ9I747_9NEOP|nr:hypothetical protein PR048_005052 [Dryococelus australis]